MRRDSGSSNEIAFADVSVAIVGPVLLLFVIYMILAGITQPPPIESDGKCQPLAGDEITREARLLSEWVVTAGADQTQDEGRLRNLCPVAYGKLDSVAQVPARLARYCPAHHEDILRTAGLARADVMRLAGRRQATLALLRDCIQDAVLPGPTLLKVNFEAGKLTLIHDAKVNGKAVTMTQGEIDGFIDRKSEEILNTLKNPEKFIPKNQTYRQENLPSKNSINRIEFIGHTDDTGYDNPDLEHCKIPISSCHIINDNYDLSYNRAKYIMRLVEKRLRGDPEIGPRLEKSHPNRLSLIVVGAADEDPADGVPVVADGRLGTAAISRKRDGNRRIEARYLSDDRQRGKMGASP